MNFKKPVGKDASDLQLKTQLDDFEIVSVLGKGAFGKVYLVQKKITKEVFAMKSLRKDTIIDLQQLECTLFEKKILQQIRHPFLVSMEYIVQNAERIFFIMRFVRGGELFTILRDESKISEERAKMYTFNIALAIGYLHTK